MVQFSQLSVNLRAVVFSSRLTERTWRRGRRGAGYTDEEMERSNDAKQ